MHRQLVAAWRLGNLDIGNFLRKLGSLECINLWRLETWNASTCCSGLEARRLGTYLGRHDTKLLSLKTVENTITTHGFYSVGSSSRKPSEVFIYLLIFVLWLIYLNCYVCLLVLRSLHFNFLPRNLLEADLVWIILIFSTVQ